MVEQVFAAFMLVVCLAMMLRAVLKPSWRRRLDGAFRRAWLGLGRPFRRPKADPRGLSDREARRLAEETIRRAREGEWDGNVYRPRAFRKEKERRRE